MKISAFYTTSAAAIALIAGTVHASNTQTSEYPVAIAAVDEPVLEQLAQKMFLQLPREHQAAIAQAGGIGSENYESQILDLHHDADAPPLPEVDPGITAAEYLELLVSDELAARMDEGQWTILRTIAKSLDEGKTLPHMCFSPDTDREYAYAVNQLIEFPFQVRFQQTTRWTSTATDGGGLTQGTPTTLTYSFVPDGTFVPDLGIGLGSGGSQLFAWLDGIYNGNTQQWQDLFHQVFDRWEELIGVDYVFEPNDDGSNTNTGAGILGVRGDVRIAAYNFANDGSGGVLAYNNFPQDGDMVFDAFDTFYNNTSSNSLRFRNVAAHEHGHGLGMLHVCPVQQSKLMEPFVSTAFNGPQLDDILNGIRHYGDVYEPNNSIAEATDLGSLSVGGASGLSNIGIDDNSDDDYFSINLTEPGRVTFAVAPDAGVYQQGPQTSACNTGATTDYNSIQNLRITAINSSGTVLAVGNSTGFGEIETLEVDVLDGGEIYFIVDGATSVNNVQRYQASALVTDIPFMGPTIATTPPMSVDPGVVTDFSVTIDPREDTIVPGTALLNVSVNGGSYQSIPLIAGSGNEFTAQLPSVLCDDTVAFFLEVEGDVTGVMTFPEDGAAAPFTAVVGTLIETFADNFESNLGWFVNGDVSGQASGVWQRGVPAGDGSRGDAPNDADGSGACYLTGNGGPGSNTDVDGGQTILNSPLLDLSDNPEATLSYSRWYDNTGSGSGAAPGADVFTVEISNNAGITWTTLEVVGPSTAESSGGWFDSSFRVADFVAPTSAVVVRFIAEDAGEGSVIEAAVDAFSISGLSCENPATCPADLTGDGVLNFFDVSAFLAAFSNGDLVADFTGDGTLNFFDVSEFLAAYSAGCP